MAAAPADGRHPAFNKLFIESEYLPELDALLFRRRPRAESEAPVFLAHLALAAGDTQALAGGHSRHADAQHARTRAIGRASWVAALTLARAPQALLLGRNTSGLSGTVGATLDPIMSLQREIDLQPGETVQLAFLTLAADSRAKLLDVAGRYRSWPAIEHAIGQARSRAELELRQSSLSTVELERFQTLLSALLYPQPGLRAAPATLAANTRGQPALWAYGISGDYPILLVRIAAGRRPGRHSRTAAGARLLAQTRVEDRPGDPEPAPGRLQPGLARPDPALAGSEAQRRLAQPARRDLHAARRSIERSRPHPARGGSPGCPGCRPDRPRGAIGRAARASQSHCRPLRPNGPSWRRMKALCRLWPALPI